MTPINGTDMGESYAKIADAALDITGAEQCEVLIDWSRKVIHVNVNGVCALRVCRIKEISLGESPR
jgi:hypothetical protein